MKENTVKFDYSEFDDYFIHTESPADIIPKLEALRISYLELCLDQAQLDFSGDARYSHEIEWAITHSWLLQDFIKLLKSLHCDKASHSVDDKSDAIEQKAASLENDYSRLLEESHKTRLDSIRYLEEYRAIQKELESLHERYQLQLEVNVQLMDKIDALKHPNPSVKE